MLLNIINQFICIIKSKFKSYIQSVNRFVYILAFYRFELLSIGDAVNSESYPQFSKKIEKNPQTAFALFARRYVALF